MAQVKVEYGVGHLQFVWVSCYCSSICRCAVKHSLSSQFLHKHIVVVVMSCVQSTCVNVRRVPIMNCTIFCTSLTAITCSVSLGSITNGQVTYSPDTTPPYDFGTVATFSCNTGFSLSVDVVRTCGGDGSSQSGEWSGSSPVCVGELLHSSSMYRYTVRWYINFTSHHSPIVT